MYVLPLQPSYFGLSTYKYTACGTSILRDFGSWSALTVAGLAFYSASKFHLHAGFSTDGPAGGHSTAAVLDTTVIVSKCGNSGILSHEPSVTLILLGGC